MASVPRSGNFLKSRSWLGYLMFLAFCAVLSGAVGYGFYFAEMSAFKAHKTEEKITALQLVDAFVTSYSEVIAKFPGQAPVPATFRAHSIELFNKATGDGSEFRLRWVGREGRSIATPPADAAMAQTIEELATGPDPRPRSAFMRIDGNLVFRTVYPSFARQQSCVDCHNRLQPDMHWQLGDLVGAFAIDVPAGTVLRESIVQAGGLGFALFFVLAAVGFGIALFHYRQNADREAAQVSLKESEERFRDFAESASDWFWEQDENLRFLYVSHGAPTADGGTQLGKTRRDFALGVSDEQWAAHDEDMQARRPFQDFRFQRVTPEGEVHHVSVSGRPIFDAEGRFRGYRGTGRDITAAVNVEMELARRVEERTAELRRAQHELLSKERLSVLGQLTATVAHELRNPLSAIRNTIFAMKESLARSGINLERPILRVERNIGRCDRIISDLLDFTRSPALNCAAVEGDRWLEEMLDEHRLPDGIALRREFGARGMAIALDAERMRRVIVNLLDNAAQAMGEGENGGRERRITVRTAAGPDGFEFTIEDNGPGIPNDVLPKVFEPLFSTKSFGTGLGLPTVRQIVEQHGGTVEIGNQPGGGARILVRLPAAAQEEIAA